MTPQIDASSRSSFSLRSHHCRATYNSVGDPDTALADLKASANFLELQKQLADTENQIQYARRYYNGAVNLYNNRQQRFPDLLIANAFGFKRAEFFQLDDDAKAAAPGVALS